MKKALFCVAAITGLASPADVTGGWVAAPPCRAIQAPVQPSLLVNIGAPSLSGWGAFLCQERPRMSAFDPRKTFAPEVCHPQRRCASG